MSEETKLLKAWKRDDRSGSQAYSVSAPHASVPCSHDAVPRCYHLPQLREPRSFPPSHLFLFVKGVSGSQFSHNFSPELQLLTRSASPPTPFPTLAPGLRYPPPPSGNRPNQLSKRAQREIDTRVSQTPCRVDFGWTGGGGTETETEGEIKLPSAPYLSIDSGYAGGNFQAKRARGGLSTPSELQSQCTRISQASRSS